jgi:type IV pilus assembly protein PilO
MTLDAEQQKRLLASVIIAFSFCYSYWMYGINPTEAKIKKREDQITQLKAEILDAKVKARRLPDIKREYESMQLQIADINKQLPTENDLPGLLHFLSDQFAKFHLSPKIITPGTLKEEGLYQSYVIQITLTGRFHDVGRFLTVLGTQQRILSADNLKLAHSTTEEKGNEGGVQATFGMIAYSSKG